MNQRRKLLESIRNNPRDVRFEDACSAAVELGFTCTGGSGSHRAYTKPGCPVGLNFQNRNGKIPTYQARQLIAQMDEHDDQS